METASDTNKLSARETKGNSVQIASKTIPFEASLRQAFTKLEINACGTVTAISWINSDFLSLGYE